ncbi:hypothetical protein H4S07_000297 [Coemansia furcata]|uniref:Uncharacterized protein n=1 Tax=Coemansia furcata TaxID=417177 RepID=A0ACC1LR37_9FUNG|nr:hypothetical protein H4S07_000297 [Coemansia furcata]
MVWAPELNLLLMENWGYQLRGIYVIHGHIAMATQIKSKESYLETKSIMGAVNISQLEEFLLTWNGIISTGAEFSMQLEQLQYMGGPIVKFNHELSTLINCNNLDPNNLDTIFCYINKFIRKPYVHTCLMEARFDKL